MSSYLLVLLPVISYRLRIVPLLFVAALSYEELKVQSLKDLRGLTDESRRNEH